MENLVKESPALLKTEGANNLNIPLSWLGNELWVVLDVLKLADQSNSGGASALLQMEEDFLAMKRTLG